MPANPPKLFLLESKSLLLLSIPLIISGVVETSIGFFSNIFLAHLGTTELAAGALVNWVFSTIMVIIWGTFSAITVLVARYFGENNHEEICCVFYAGLFLAVLLMLPSMLLLWNLAPIFLFFGQDVNTVLLAQAYLHGLSWAIIPDFIITILLQFLAGLGRTRITLAFSLIFVPINIFFNYSLMFGKLGLPALGIAGIGWGSAISFWIVTLGFSIYFFSHKIYQLYLRLPHLQKIRKALKEIFQVGLPIGLMYCIEVGFFLGTTIVMGLISINTLSANQLTLQFYWLFSIVTFSLAQGITIQVGHKIGSGNQQSTNYATYLGVFYSCAFMLLPGILYWFFANDLIMLDFDLKSPKNAEIIHLAKEFLMLAGFVQLVEAIRFAFFGALRGLKDTRFTLYISIFIYWIITLPLGYLLAIVFGMQGYGIWVATLLGQIIGTPLMIIRYRRKVEACFSR
jgi:multidrug resistance protein, MATE family